MCLEGFPDASEVTAAQRKEIRELPWIVVFPTHLCRRPQRYYSVLTTQAHCTSSERRCKQCPLVYGMLTCISRATSSFLKLVALASQIGEGNGNLLQYSGLENPMN